MKKLKTKMMLFAAIICTVIFILAAFLFIYKTQSLADIIATKQTDLTWASINSVSPGEGYNEMFASSDQSDVKYIVQLFSNMSVHLVERNVNHAFQEEGDNFVIMLMEKNGTDYHIYYDNGYVYYKNCKYKVSAADIEPFINGLETICSD